MINMILTSIQAALDNGSHPYIECCIYSPMYRAWLPADLVSCDIDLVANVSRYFRRRGMKNSRFVVTVGIRDNKKTVYTNEANL